VVVIMDCEVENAAAYWPWFDAAPTSLEIWTTGEGEAPPG